MLLFGYSDYLYSMIFLVVQGLFLEIGLMSEANWLENVSEIKIVWLRNDTYISQDKIKNNL